MKNIDNLINGNIESPQIQDKNYITEKINAELLREFELEIADDLKIIENNTPKLDKDPDKEILNSIFCAVHSITGSAECSGHILIHRIASQVEVLLERCRKGEITINNNVINLILTSKFYINDICDNFSLIKDQSFLNSLYQYLESMETANFQEEIFVDKEYWQDFIAETNEHLENIEMNVLVLERDAQNIQVINAMFKSFHSIKGLAGFVNQNLVQEISHKTETILTDCIKGNIVVNSDIVDLILSSADCIKQICSDISLNRNYSFLKTINEHLKLLESIQTNIAKVDFDLEVIAKKEEITKKIGEILVDQNTLNKQEVEEILRKQKEQYSDLSFGQIAVKEHKAKPREILNAIRKQQIHKAVITQDDFMRVPVNKINNLVDIINELVTTQSLMEQESANFTTTDLFQDNMTKLSEITKNIESISLFLKVVPLKSTFQKISRIARDAMTELKKDINFVIQGEDIEIDRNIAEKLLVPLLHIVRNAISHGIEDKDERAKTDKKLQGTVNVSSYFMKGKFYIKVSDDGKGINLKKIYNKALEQNLINPEKDYQENEIIDLIFLPGFSSAKNIDNISGRGIGLDIVKEELQKISGKIHINNRIGKGCTFILEMPVKNVIMNGIIVDIKGLNHFIPSTFIRQIIKPQEQDWIYTENKKTMIRLEECPIPLIYTLEPESTDYTDNTELVILLDINQKYVAVPINKIIERRKINMSALENENILLIPDIEKFFIDE